MSSCRPKECRESLLREKNVERQNSKQIVRTISQKSNRRFGLFLFRPETFMYKQQIGRRLLLFGIKVLNFSSQCPKPSVGLSLSLTR